MFLDQVAQATAQYKGYCKYHPFLHQSYDWGRACWKYSGRLHNVSQEKGADWRGHHWMEAATYWGTAVPIRHQKREQHLARDREAKWARSAKTHFRIILSVPLKAFPANGPLNLFSVILINSTKSKFLRLGSKTNADISANCNCPLLLQTCLMCIRT